MADSMAVVCSTHREGIRYSMKTAQRGKIFVCSCSRVFSLSHQGRAGESGRLDPLMAGGTNEEAVLLESYTR